MPNNQRIIREGEVVKQPVATTDDTDQSIEVFQRPAESVEREDLPTMASDRIVREEVVQNNDDVSVRRVAKETIVIPSAATVREANLTRHRHRIYFIVHVISIIIIIRFLLLALGADPASAFANFMYALSLPFVAPFRGLFGIAPEPQYGVSVFEWSNIVAILIYYLIAWIASNTLKLMYKPKPAPHRAPK